MLVVCFGDGLGNQMFQYAFYISLKHHYPNNNVKMDIFNIYGGHIHNGFELSRVFGIDADECSKRETLILADYCPRQEYKYRLANVFYGFRRYVCGVKDSFITQDDPTCYYKGVYDLSELKSYIFKGNWVNEKYFDAVKEEVISAFSFPEITDDSNLFYKKRIESCESVSVHIRRGDYINSGMLNLPIEYYSRAKEIIENKISKPHYYIFTDDKDGIAEYLNLFNENYTIVVGNKKENSFRDMQLMSLCKHNIIPNSTFSFWGAYLNKNPNKIVIAPNKAKYDFKNPFACNDWMVIPYDGKY